MEETKTIKISEVKEAPKVPSVVLVEAVLMPNREILRNGKTIMWQDNMKGVYNWEIDDEI